MSYFVTGTVTAADSNSTRTNTLTIPSASESHMGFIELFPAKEVSKRKRIARYMRKSSLFIYINEGKDSNGIDKVNAPDA